MKYLQTGRRYAAAALLLLPFNLCAQDLTGLWKGTLYNDTTGLTLPYELGISQKKGKLTGYSHTVFLIDRKEFIGLKEVRLKKKNDKLLVEDVELIYNNYPSPPPKGVRMFSVLNVTAYPDSIVLTGLWNTNRTKEYLSATGSLHLKRTFDHSDSRLLAKLKEEKIDENALSFMKAKEDTIITEIVMNVDIIPVKPKPEPVIVKVEPRPVEKKIVPPVVVKKEPVVVKQEPIVVKKEPVVVKKEPVVVKKEPVVVKKEPIIVKADPKPIEKKIEPSVIKATPIVIKKEPLPVTTLPPASIIANAATEITKRKTEAVQQVYFKSDSLVISLFDNGYVDGDTVSVLMNGQVIIARAGLTERAVNKTIYIPAGSDSVQLVMYAENLGSLPPNTGLLVVRDGGDNIEVRFSADMSKNSGITLRRRR